MKKILFCIILVCLFFQGENASAWAFPFTDVPVTSPYYSSVKSLYEDFIISDDGSHLFRPDASIDRGSFVGLSVSVSCRKCITPSIEDIVRYATSPFIDLSKTHPIYYCIAYAAEKNIVQWYTLDASGKWSCEDGGVFSKAPFCQNNKTTRIESAAMLLRQANLWNDTLNQNITRTTPISDVSDYWYGYALKWIQAWILRQKADMSIGPDEYVTRWEFAMMAAKMYDYNQCESVDSDTSLASSIQIIWSDGRWVGQSTFDPTDTFRLSPVIHGGGSANDYKYEWIAYDLVTHKKVTATSPELLSSLLWAGNWNIELSIIDKTTGNIVSTPSTTLFIGDGNTPSSGSPGNIVWNGGGDNPWSSLDGKSYPSVFLTASTLNVEVWGSIDFSSFTLGQWLLTYTWDFGDGTRISWSIGGSDTSLVEKSHTFLTPWFYTITVTSVDAEGNTAQSQMIIEVTGDTDSDGDGVGDSTDICPNIIWPRTNNGCPVIDTNNYTRWIDTGITPIIPIGNGVWNTGNGIGSSISVVWPDGKILTGSTFGSGQDFSLVPKTSENGNYTYEWKATDSVTGRVIFGSGTTFDGGDLGTGNWSIDLTIKDSVTGAILSRPSTTITIGDGGNVAWNVSIVGNGNGSTGNGSTGNGLGIWGNLLPSITLWASNLSIIAGWSIDFSSVALGVWPLTYTWDFGDGTPASTGSANASHRFDNPGTYTIRASITDADGKTVSSSIIVKITPGDSDGDGVNDSIDLCRNVSWPTNNNGCPFISSILWSLEKNACIRWKVQSQWLIIATPICDQCPCTNTITFWALLKSCDIIFPTILSPGLTEVYSRWGFYQLP